MKGRPLRFLATVVGGWVAVRIAILWPPFVPPPSAPSQPASPAAPDVATRVARAPGSLAPPGGDRRDVPVAAARPAVAPRPVPPDAFAPARRDAPAPSTPPPPRPPAADDAPPPPLDPAPRPPRRWWASGWAVARGGDAGALAGGQLGGSQAGVRIVRTLDPAGRVAATLRLSAPLAGRGQEAAPGIEWRLPDTPVRLIAERRIAIDGGRGGVALLATAGLPPTRLAGLTLEGYGQAGAVERFGAFADGAARLTRAIGGGAGVRVDAGLGLWGGAQRGAARLDAGPSVGVVVPVGGRQVRMTLDWRARIAGRAAPGSGPALSIGSDF